MNYFKTFLLMTGFMVLFGFVGNYVGGRQGMIIAFSIALGINFFSYWFSDKIVLMQYRAQPIKRPDAPELYRSVEKLSKTAKIPMPRVYIINEGMPNAFATGRNPQNGVVAVTTGLLQMLDREEIEGVLAHELSHIKHRDILTGTIAAALAAAIILLARFGMFFGGRDDNGGGIGMLLMFILAPLAAIIVQLMISRSMEYSADTGAAKITGKPQYMISALKKIHRGVKGVRRTRATPETSHMLIASPFKGALAGLFSTHPTLEKRIKNLENLK